MMSILPRAPRWLDAVAVAIVVTSLVFGIVGAMDAHPEPLSVVLLAGVRYALGGAVLGAVLTLVSAAASWFSGRARSAAALAASGITLALSVLVVGYLTYWVEADLLAGTKWYDSISIVAVLAVGVAVSGLTGYVLRFTSRAPELGAEAALAFRVAAVGIVALVGLGLAPDSQSVRRDSRGPIAPVERPNVIVVVLDTVRADFTSLHGYPRPVTPSFERLAREGVQFVDAQSTASWTLPAVTSLLTSRLPGTAVKQGAAFVGSQRDGLPEALAEMGYETVLISNNPYVFGPFGIAAHFDAIDTGRSEWLPPSTIVERIAKRLFAVNDGALVAGAIRWLERNDDGPFFMYLHLMGGHSPYRIPRGYRTPIEVPPAANDIDFPTHALDITEDERESLRSRYAATIRYADDQVGRLLSVLDERRLADSTLVVLTSDHGEEFGDHGGWGHGATLYREVLHIPMVWRWPGRVPAGERRSGVVSLIDVAPSVLAVIGPSAGTSRGWLGRDLDVTGTATGTGTGMPSVNRASVAEVAPALKSLTTGNWKYIVNEESQREWLFDRGRDPWETTNLVAERPETLRRLRRTLSDLGSPTSADGEGDATQPQPIGPDVVQRLRALGYVP